MPSHKPFQIASLLPFDISLPRDDGCAPQHWLRRLLNRSLEDSRDFQDLPEHYVDVELVPENTQSHLVASEPGWSLCCCLELEGG